ncbi:MAG: hypothetical protein R2809_14730 [Flavobacteriales bacterium]
MNEGFELGRIDYDEREELWLQIIVFATISIGEILEGLAKQDKVVLLHSIYLDRNSTVENLIL